jgi:hypothetical protein
MLVPLLLSGDFFKGRHIGWLRKSEDGLFGEVLVTPAYRRIRGGWR